MTDVQAHDLVKEYGRNRAVEGVSFRLRPGTVTGFLGPNGSGKSTTMRMLLGLDRPTSGTVTIDGRVYRQHVWPLHEVGAVLDAKAVYPGRTALAHLRALAASNGISRARAEEVLEAVGLADVAHRRVGTFSLGMSQRLGIAGALLGDPGLLLLDEPVDGLDPDGVAWIRDLMRSLAAEGRTVLVSSHLMSEMALTADHLLVIGRGRLLADVALADLLDGAGHGVRVETADPAELGNLVRGIGGTVEPAGDGALLVTGVDAAAIGRVAATRMVVLHQLTDVRPSLEEVYFRLTAGEAAHSSTPAQVAAAA